MTSDKLRLRLELARASAHPHCVVCSQSNNSGLGVNFELHDDGSVRARFDCDIAFEGYPDCVHGGVISSLVDGAMVNCLFAHGRTAVTAELKIRYRHPVVSNRDAEVRAWIVRSSPPLHILAAEILQGGKVCVRSTAKFMDRPEPTRIR